jgi:NAD(P)-dependent dehydrogenase (short-subunit alcohol dehydrogenase family)
VLREIDGAGFAHAVDVSDRQQVYGLAEAVFRSVGRANLLFNNAGVVRHGEALTMPDEEWEWIHAVNFWGVVHGVRAFATRMLHQPGRRQIVNTSSLAGVATSPYATTAYHASKFAVTGFSLMVREELAASDIGVTTVVPGMVASNLSNSTQVRPDRFGGPTEAAPGPRPAGDGGRAASAWAGAQRQPEDVAPAIVDAALRNRRLVFTHAENRLTVDAYAQGILAGFD